MHLFTGFIGFIVIIGVVVFVGRFSFKDAVSSNAFSCQEIIFSPVRLTGNIIFAGSPDRAALPY